MKDTKGRSWSIDINTWTVKRVRDAKDINLLELLAAGSTLNEKLQDPVTLVDVLFVLCERQAKELGVEDEEFGRSLDADAIEAGMLEILEGVANFSPGPLRPAMATVAQKTRRFQQKARQRVAEELDALEKTLDAEIERLLTAALPVKKPTLFSIEPSSSSDSSETSTPAGSA